MGLFDFLKFLKTRNYVSQAAFEANLSEQSRMTAQTMEQLRKYGVREDSALKLEFFFYTDVLSKAKRLVEELSVMGYLSEYAKSTSNSNEFVINGWTDPVQMQNSKILEWTRLMCEAGYKHDCDFDGWGTKPSKI